MDLFNMTTFVSLSKQTTEIWVKTFEFLKVLYPFFITLMNVLSKVTLCKLSNQSRGVFYLFYGHVID